ncbi:MAG: YHS domain-containing protein [Capsulimonadaceae bacterium]|nr:YHS domain-containing protein [Capsulimonadaceae bacterium]
MTKSISALIAAFVFAGTCAIASADTTSATSAVKAKPAAVKTTVKAKAAVTKHTAKAKAAVVAKVTCPVTGETVTNPKTAPFSTYKGKKYYFCCPMCKPKFDAEPSKYVKSAKAAPATGMKMPAGHSM